MTNYYFPKLSSLETNWLSKYDRHLPNPLVIFVEDCSYGGIYIYPDKNPTIAEGIEIPPSNGALIVGIFDELTPESVMAHEWRHHWQHYNGWKYDGIGWDTETTYDNYENNISDYFTHSKSEQDALNFELFRSPCDHAFFLRELVLNSKKNIKGN